MADDDAQFAHHPPNPAGDQPAQPIENPTSFTIHRGGAKGMQVGKAKTLKAAMRAIDRHDRAYGAAVHGYKPVFGR